CAVTTVGVHRRLFHGRPRTGRASGTFRLDQRCSGRLVGASAITLVGLGCGDERRDYAVWGRFEGEHTGKSVGLLGRAGAVEAWVRRLLAAFAWCLALPQEPGAEMAGVIRRRENPGGGARVLLAVRVFLSRYKGNSLPVPEIPCGFPSAGRTRVRSPAERTGPGLSAVRFTCRLPPRTATRCRQGCDRAR